MRKHIITVIIFLFPNMLQAQWIQVPGPYGGTIRSLTGYGTKLFAGTDNGGVFASPVQGFIWNKTNNGLPLNADVWTMAVKDNDIYAGTWEGLYKSTNDGQQWQPVPFFGSQVISSISVIDTTIYVSANQAGIYKSVDNGVSWTLISSGTPVNFYIKNIVKQGNDYFAGTFGSGVYKSVNGDNNWVPSNTGISTLSVYSLVSDGTNLFAGTSTGVFVSDDNGVSWVLSGLSSTFIFSLNIKGTKLFAGTNFSMHVYDLSLGSSGSWSSSSNGLPFETVYAVYSEGNMLYAGTYASGFFWSANDGVSWTESNTGITNLHVSDLLLSGTKFYAATSKGLYYSLNSGSAWTKYNISSVYAESCGSVIESATHLITTINTPGNPFIGFSTDSGTTWSTSMGLPNLSFYKLVALGSSVLTTTSNGATCLIRTTNNGASWSLANNNLANRLIGSLATDGISIYAAASSTGPGGLFKSYDFGVSWNVVGAGILPGALRVVKVYGDTVIAGSAAGEVFISTSGGAQWNSPGTGIPAIAPINALLAEGNIIIAGTEEGVYVTNDFGLTWHPFNTGLTTTKIYSLMKVGTAIYAGTNGGGIFTNASLLTDVRELTENTLTFSVYPNPFAADNANITLSLNSEIRDANLDIFNVAGQKVYTQQLKTSKSILQLPTLVKGVYFVKITSATSTGVRKIVVN